MTTDELIKKLQGLPESHLRMVCIFDDSETGEQLDYEIYGVEAGDHNENWITLKKAGT